RTPLLFPWDMRPYPLLPSAARRTALQASTHLWFSFSSSFASNELSRHRLSWSIHSAEKSAEVARDGQNRYCHGLDRQAVSGQNCARLSLRSHVDEPHDPDQQARRDTEHQVHQKDALEALPFELPLPGENSRDQYRYGCERRGE